MMKKARTGEHKTETKVPTIFELAESKLPLAVRSYAGQFAADCDVLSNVGRDCVQGFSFKSTRQTNRVECTSYCLSHCDAWFAALAEQPVVVVQIVLNDGSTSEVSYPIGSYSAQLHTKTEDRLGNPVDVRIQTSGHYNSSEPQAFVQLDQAVGISLRRISMGFLRVDWNWICSWLEALATDNVRFTLNIRLGTHTETVPAEAKEIQTLRVVALETAEGQRIPVGTVSAHGQWAGGTYFSPYSDSPNAVNVSVSLALLPQGDIPMDRQLIEGIVHDFLTQFHASREVPGAHGETQTGATELALSLLPTDEDAKEWRQTLDEQDQRLWKLRGSRTFSFGTGFGQSLS